MRGQSANENSATHLVRWCLPQLLAALSSNRKALREAAASTTARDASRYFRLPIDRAFAMKGFGSLVTGSPLSGSVGSAPLLPETPPPPRPHRRSRQYASPPPSCTISRSQRRC